MAQADTWMQGLDVGAVVHYTGQYEDDNVSLTRSSKPQMPRSGPYPGSHGKCASGLHSISSGHTSSIWRPPAPVPVPGFDKDGEKLKMKDGKEKNVMPVSTAECNCLWMGRLVE